MTARTWPLQVVWPAAVEISAARYGVDPDELDQATRGRGPRPPRAAWVPRKWAIYLTVLLSECGYAGLAKHLGMNKSTVSDFCEHMRQACDADQVEEGLERLRLICEERLAEPPSPARTRRRRAAVRASLPSRVEALEKLVSDLLSRSDERPLIRPTGPDHGTVIEFKKSVA